MTTEADCREAARQLLGQSLAQVTYVGLWYEQPDAVRWDFGDWHWPEVGVELTTSSGDTFYGIWDSKVTHFELTFAQGDIAEQLIPLREEPITAHSWDVGDHPRWQSLLHRPIESYALAFAIPDNPPVTALVAARFQTSGGSFWIVSAAPRDTASAPEDLRQADVYVGHDEVIVVFGDDRAEMIGLTQTR